MPPSGFDDDASQIWQAAAIDGALPILQKIIEQGSPLKQFALPIMCDIAKASKRARSELKQVRSRDVESL